MHRPRTGRALIQPCRNAGFTHRAGRFLRRTHRTFFARGVLLFFKSRHKPPHRRLLCQRESPPRHQAPLLHQVQRANSGMITGFQSQIRTQLPTSPIGFRWRSRANAPPGEKHKPAADMQPVIQIQFDCGQHFLALLQHCGDLITPFFRQGEYGYGGGCGGTHRNQCHLPQSVHPHKR